jgi:hypothetical protein
MGVDTPVKLIRMCASIAGIAQLVEHNLAKVGVASSSLVSRSRFCQRPRFFAGAFAFPLIERPGRNADPCRTAKMR